MLLSAGLLAEGCSSLGRVAPLHSGVWPEFKPYLDEFVAAAKAEGVDVSWRARALVVHRAGKLMGPTVATCYVTLVGGNEIELDGSLWDRISASKRMDISFHELGHCLLGRMHTYEGGRYPKGTLSNMGRGPGYLADGCPQSIMHPVVLEPDCVVTHWQGYVKELFSVR